MSTTTKTFTRPMLPHGMLRGKTAIVTGGGTGLGKGMALEYARLGANVAIAGRREDVLAEAEAEIARHRGGTLAMKTDVRKPEDVDAFVEAVVGKFGGVDILVNNAAGNFVVPSIDLSANGWRAVIDIVLNGTWFFSHDRQHRRHVCVDRKSVDRAFRRCEGRRPFDDADARGRVGAARYSCEHDRARSDRRDGSGYAAL
jgi:NAD(P)-dependent dehydrogenase (short-subunit alcohol dehydrogenase family)